MKCEQKKIVPFVPDAASQNEPRKLVVTFFYFFAKYFSHNKVPSSVANTQTEMKSLEHLCLPSALQR